MPIYRRLPKRGFNNIFRADYRRGEPRLAAEGGRRRHASTPAQPVDAAALIAAGLVGDAR